MSNYTIKNNMNPANEKYEYGQRYDYSASAQQIFQYRKDLKRLKEEQQRIEVGIQTVMSHLPAQIQELLAMDETIDKLKGDA